MKRFGKKIHKPLRIYFCVLRVKQVKGTDDEPTNDNSSEWIGRYGGGGGAVYFESVSYFFDLASASGGKRRHAEIAVLPIGRRIAKKSAEGSMPVGGLIAVFVILGLFLSMLTSSPRTIPPKRDKSSSDTVA